MSKFPWKTFAIIFLGILLCISVVSSRFMADAISKSTIASLNIQVQDLKSEIDNWKKLYTEVYNINKDYIKDTKEISDILYMTNMPVGGTSDTPAIQITDKLNQKVLDSLIGSLKANRDTFDSIKISLETRQKIINDFPFVYPLKKGGTVQISSGFGFRYGVFKNDKGLLKEHPGVDLVADIGDPVVASADGTIEWIEIKNPIYGKLIIIGHAIGFRTYYAHLSVISIRRGQKVKSGDIIGYVGNTGETTGPHLHYEIRIGEIPIDPMNFISVKY
jgi:murein DD-endopeptidase MepM/ murein hydrolase activator NlpD